MGFDNSGLVMEGDQAFEQPHYSEIALTCTEFTPERCNQNAAETRFSIVNYHLIA